MPSLRQLYRLTQVAILLAFLALLVLLHFRNRQEREHQSNLREIDEVRRGALEQKQLSDELLARAKQKLAEAEAWQPAWIDERPAEKPPESGERGR